MDNNHSLIDLWNYMEFAEKQQLMKQFREIHGNHYNKDDFVKFLAERSKGLNQAFETADGKSPDGL